MSVALYDIKSNLNICEDYRRADFTVSNYKRSLLRNLIGLYHILTFPLFLRVPELPQPRNWHNYGVYISSFFSILHSLWWSILTLCGRPSRVLEKGIMVSERRKYHDSVIDLIYKGYWWQNRGIISNLVPPSHQPIDPSYEQASLFLISISWFLLWHQ